jgi:putative restriction endonuclease
VAHVKGAAAPHKPILLLAIVDGIQKGEIENNKVYITPELVATFKDYWYKLVQNPVFTANFSLPFYHLQSEGFWYLHTLIGKEVGLTSSRSIKSFGHLKEVVEHASFDDDLYALLCDQQTREILRQVLLSTYFKAVIVNSDNNNFTNTIIHQILHEPAAVYKNRVNAFDEEEVCVRSGIFKKQVPRIYNYTCCISGMRIITNRDVQMIDACHIVPFSESHDDTISNGISLCPNLHRAFDRGLIAIDDDYCVMVSPFHEASDIYGIRQFEGKKILLPDDNEYFPSIVNLAKHRVRFNY